MNIKIFFNIQVLLICSLLLSGCPSSLTPMQVSDKFWVAVKNKNLNEAKKHIASGTLGQESADNILPIDDVTLGRTIIDGDKAWIETTVIVAGKDTYDIPLETILLKQSDQWKVDYDATVDTLTSDNSVARVIGNIGHLSDQFAEDLDESLEEIQKAIPEVQKEIKKIEENVRHHLPEIQQRMDELIRQLEDALEDLNRDTEHRDTTEI